MHAQTDVFIAMELMGTCAEKLKKRIQGPIPERILGKMTVAVSVPCRRQRVPFLMRAPNACFCVVFVSAVDSESIVVPERETWSHPSRRQTLQHPHRC